MPSGRRCTTKCGGSSGRFSTISNFHGTNTVADEKKYEPYVASIASRADLNYIFQEMLSAFSVGHLAREWRADSGGEAGAGRTAGSGLRDQGQSLLHREDLYGRGIQSAREGSAGATGAEREGGRLHSRHQRAGTDGGCRYSAAARGNRGQGDQRPHCGRRTARIRAIFR